MSNNSDKDKDKDKILAIDGCQFESCQNASLYYVHIREGFGLTPHNRIQLEGSFCHIHMIEELQESIRQIKERFELK